MTDTNKLNANTFPGLVSDEDFEILNSAYDSLSRAYALELFGCSLLNQTNPPFDKTETLECAVFLSSLRGGPFAEQAWLMAQEMIAMLSKLYPEDPEVEYFSGMVLSHIGNYTS